MKIAYGNSRLSKKWINKKTTFEDFCSRLETTIRTTETVAEYRKMSKSKRMKPRMWAVTCLAT